MLGSNREQAAESALGTDMQVRFRIQIDKCIQGMQHLAQRKPGISHYYVGKIFFFADREHLVDCGRPISGDRYVAMEHGPVPITMLSIIKDNAGISEEVREKFQSRLRREWAGNHVKLWPHEQAPEFPSLSGSDIKYLDDSLSKYGELDFGQLRELSHHDEAYQNAMAKPGENNDLNPVDWLGYLGTPEEIVDELYNMGVIERNCH